MIDLTKLFLYPLTSLKVQFFRFRNPGFPNGVFVLFYEEEDLLELFDVSLDSLGCFFILFFVFT